MLQTIIIKDIFLANHRYIPRWMNKLGSLGSKMQNSRLMIS